LDKDRFWSVIESSRIGAAGDQDAQYAALHAHLSALTVEEIEKFDALFRQAMQEAYRWDLWAIAYIVLGGCSDDGFHYFCDWLISMGRDCFEATLRNPDSLAAYIEDMDDDQEAFEFGAFDSVACNVWEKKTGKDIMEMPDQGVKGPSGPTGEPWKDEGSEEYFAATFPQLWARFGS
jgi:hypothetical protein